jgi:cytochrome b561
MDKARKIITRATVSILLFFLIIILSITAVGIQILDEIIDPELLLSAYLNPEIPPAFLVELLHIVKAVHVIAGLLFVGLVAVHIVKNWKALKSYFKKQNYGV